MLSFIYYLTSNWPLYVAKALLFILVFHKVNDGQCINNKEPT